MSDAADELGRAVHRGYCEWLKQQEHPKPVEPDQWDELSEKRQEMYRHVGIVMAKRIVLQAIDAETTKGQDNG